MQRFFLEPGLVILREGRHLEFHHRGQRALYFEDPLTRDFEALTETEFWTEFETKALTICHAHSSPTTLRLPPPEQESALPFALPAKYECDHLRKLDYVAGIQKLGISRGQIELIAEAIPEIAKELEALKPDTAKPDPLPAAHTVAKWMRDLERAGGDGSVLVSGYAKKITHEHQDPEHEELIHNVIVEKLGKHPVIKIWSDHYPKALKRLNAERVEAGKQILVPLSARTFNRRVERFPAYDKAVLLHGRQAARQKFRMAKGHMPADFPREYAEIDHAKLRLWVIDDILMLPLGRPWVTAIKDRFSKMLLGFFVSFRGPSLYSTFRAIRHSLESHLNVHAHWPDLEHAWVPFGPAGTYVSDRGSDFLSPHYRRAIRLLNSDYDYCEVRTPWHKPHIERTFLTLHDDLLEAAPGHVYKGLAYHRDYNPQEDAVVRFSTLTYLLVKWAVDYQPFLAVDARGARAVDLWMDGIGDAPIGYMPNPDALNVIFGKRQTATLGNKGLAFRHLHYANNALEELLDSIGKKQLTFVPSEENLGRIRVQDPRNLQWLEVPSTDPEYAEGLSLYQHQMILREGKRAGESMNSVEQMQRFREQVRTRIAEDIYRKNSSAKTRAARFCNINSAAVLAGQSTSLADLANQGDPGLAPPASDVSRSNGKPVINDAAFLDVPTFGWAIPT